MNIEQLAREAGGQPVWFDTDNQPTATEFSAAAITRFAALVRAQALEDAALLCIHRADLQTIRANAEGNDYATERAIEATGCAAAIRALA